MDTQPAVRICTRCRRMKPIEEFAKKGNGRRSICRPCDVDIHKQRYYNLKGERERILSRTGHAHSVRTAKGLCWQCDSPVEPGSVRCKKHNDENRSRSHRMRVKVKNAIFDHYGRKCACCGETIATFLSIDHVKNDGSVHRRSLTGCKSGGSISVYLDIIRRGFPDDFQVLCMNCQFGKRMNGGVCPHEELRRASATEAAVAAAETAVA